MSFLKFALIFTNQIIQNRSSSVHVTGTAGGCESKICSAWDPKLLSVWSCRSTCNCISNSLMLIYISVLNGRTCVRRKTLHFQGTSFCCPLFLLFKLCPLISFVLSVCDIYAKSFRFIFFEEHGPGEFYYTLVSWVIGFEYMHPGS